MPKEDEIVDVVIREFPINEIPASCTWVIIGAPQSGKSTFIEDLCYWNKHKYPCARVWSETDDTQKNYQKFIKKLFITNEYVNTEHEHCIVRQKKCITEKCKKPSCIYIIDDCNTDKKIFSSKLMKGQFKNGSRWWDCLFIIGSHYVFDMGPDLRKSVSYVALFREPSHDERKKLWQNFAIGCNFKEFCQLMDQITGDYTCLIFQKRSQSNKMEDCIFYYKAREHGEWELGSKQYKKWHKKRYNKNFQENYV